MSARVVVAKRGGVGAGPAHRRPTRVTSPAPLREAQSPPVRTSGAPRSRPPQPGQCCLCSSMKRTADSTATSLEANSNCAYPPMISLVSVNGPSVTLTFPPASRTCAPSALGPSPPLPSMVPARDSSSASLAIALHQLRGGRPHLFSVLDDHHESHRDISMSCRGRGQPDAIRPLLWSNERPWIRHGPELILRRAARHAKVPAVAAQPPCTT